MNVCAIHECGVLAHVSCACRVVYMRAHSIMCMQTTYMWRECLGTFVPAQEGGMYALPLPKCEVRTSSSLSYVMKSRSRFSFGIGRESVGRLDENQKNALRKGFPRDRFV